ncbi:hypothetical protein [Alkalihalobacterium alkalinitrilicum]|uniref:hypothetical protein n=1 Tax=Alkalihalobacterium alkalinitrilicum TaxID=427920 RepID=UPI00099567DA|nr:hypothetical protein [Alkalihalobacterium alkalinitrilicum]
MKIKLGIILVVCLSITLFIQFMLYNFNEEFYQGLIVSLIVEIVGIIAVVYLIDQLIKRHEEESKWETFNHLTRLKYKYFVQKLAQNYVHVIKKKPPNGLEVKDEELHEIIDNINKYIGPNFVNEKILVYKFNPSNIYEPLNEYWNYSKFVFSIKREMNEEITKFLNRYLTLLPVEIRDSIYTIDDLLLNGVFFSTFEIGYDIVGNGNVQINEEHFKEAYKNLGIEILNLMGYIDKS